jgi:hypothetical protein
VSNTEVLFGNCDVPFFGDYNYVDVAGSKVLMNWTDSRETVGGTARYDDPAVAPDDGTDGFDVVQCREFDPATGAWSARTGARMRADSTRTSSGSSSASAERGAAAGRPSSPPAVQPSRQLPLPAGFCTRFAVPVSLSCVAPVPMVISTLTVE